MDDSRCCRSARNIGRQLHDFGEEKLVMSDEIVREFLVESTENLDLLDRELVQLEKDPGNRATLASVFRTIHTIKGTCGFLGFTKLESVAHVGENLLSKLRDGEFALTRSIATALLQMVDAIREMLQSIETVGSEGERNDQPLIQTLVKLLSGEEVEATKPPNAAVILAPVAPAEHAPPRAATNIGDILIEQGAAQPQDVVLAARIQQQGDPRHLGEIMVEQGTVKPQQVLEALHTQQANPGGVSESSIRVDVGLLDKLMNLVGELVLARNQVLQFSSTKEDAGINAPSQRLNLITTELQEGVMKTRMQPIGNIWDKFPRTVRDVAATCGKQIRLEMEGKETELDKTIIEAIKDPLTHIVRNSADHGIESPAERSTMGKSPEGRLLLRAYHEGGQVIIEISDDGAGLNPVKLKQKAIEKGLITAEQAAKMLEREAIHLIFLPGFSTAQKVTNVSGRGVGMDVVKTNIEKIGGTVDVQSDLGSGTTVKMKIPLTLAIVPGLVVHSAGKRFVIPQVSLVELVLIDDDQTRNGIEMVHGTPVYRLRGRLLPLAYLDKVLNLAKSCDGATAESKTMNMVVLQAENRQFGLMVDEIRDTEEIVVKPLGRRLKSIKAFAGATIMGDGKVALILDVLSVAQKAGIVSQHEDRTLASTEAESHDNANDKQTFLIFAGPDDARMALPLDKLARLEEFPASKVEKSGTQWVIQYREKILPLLQLNLLLEERRKSRRHPDAPEETKEPLSGASLQVLVCNDHERTIGLIVEKIVDIVENRAEVKSPATRAGVLYAAVIENRVTELLDLPAIVRAAAAIRGHEREHTEVSH
jgi:two-component system chemotaxis sensor kinase CheA